jgi:serine/threonine-protein kinase
VSPVAYVGRTATAASAALSQLGLGTNVTTLLGGTPANPDSCRVIRVSPSGEVQRGDTVTVTCQEI